MTKRGHIAPMRSILEGYLRRRHMDARTRQEQIRFCWREIVGDVVARVASVGRMADGVMYVHCATPVWAHTLSLRKNEILAKISDRVGRGVIREVRFNSLPPYASDAQEASGGHLRNGGRDQRKVPLSPKQERRIAALGASLRDEGIRESFLRAARSAAMGASDEMDEAGVVQREEGSG